MPGFGPQVGRPYWHHIREIYDIQISGMVKINELKTKVPVFFHFVPIWPKFGQIWHACLVSDYNYSLSSSLRLLERLTLEFPSLFLFVNLIKARKGKTSRFCRWREVTAILFLCSTSCIVCANKWKPGRNIFLYIQRHKKKTWRGAGLYFFSSLHKINQKKLKFSKSSDRLILSQIINFLWLIEKVFKIRREINFE